MNFVSFRVTSSFLKNGLSCKLPRLLFSTEVDVKTEIDKLVKNNKVVVFMKGVPEQPQCGFSNAVVQILRMHNVTYDAHNVLKREDIRNGIKEYSSWPTIPQVYINGEFVGGCDIILQLHQTGDLITELKKAGIKSALADNPSSNKSENKT